MRAMHQIFLICLSSERSETSEFFGQRFQTLSEDLRFADVLQPPNSRDGHGVTIVDGNAMGQSYLTYE